MVKAHEFKVSLYGSKKDACEQQTRYYIPEVGVFACEDNEVKFWDSHEVMAQAEFIVNNVLGSDALRPGEEYIGEVELPIKFVFNLVSAWKDFNEARSKFVIASENMLEHLVSRE